MDAAACFRHLVGEAVEQFVEVPERVEPDRPNSVAHRFHHGVFGRAGQPHLVETTHSPVDGCGLRCADQLAGAPQKRDRLAAHAAENCPSNRSITYLHALSKYSYVSGQSVLWSESPDSGHPW